MSYISRSMHDDECATTAMIELYFSPNALPYATTFMKTGKTPGEADAKVVKLLESIAKEYTEAANEIRMTSQDESLRNPK